MSTMQNESKLELGGLKSRLLRGATFETVGFGAAQAIRLVSNMALTRLLLPEAFGLAALVLMVNQGLTMFSDVGLEPALIQNKRGGEETFLNTAWTLQVIQGVFLTVVAVLIAYPMAQFYGNKELTWLIAVGSVGLFARGFTSHAKISLRRKMQVGKLVTLELIVQTVSTVVTIGLAYWLRSVWGLVFGLAIGAIASAALSYRLPADCRHRLVIDPEAKTAILKIGKWVFLSSIATFLTFEGDRLFMGKAVGITDLGIYSIAVLLSGAVSGVVSKVIRGVVFPALSAVRERGLDELRHSYYRVRKGLDYTVMPALGGLCALGTLVVEVLYDDRYADAGWMLQLLVLRAALSCMLIPCDTCLFVVGQARILVFKGVATALWMVVALPIGFHYYGIEGIVVASALAEIPVLLVLWPAFRAERLFVWAYELRSFAFVLAGYCVGTALEPMISAVIP